jgi:hypothetical protein
MKMNAHIYLKPYGNKTEDLRKSLAMIPEDATYDVSIQNGDRPYDSDTYTITFSWEQ